MAMAEAETYLTDAIAYYNSQEVPVPYSPNQFYLLDIIDPDQSLGIISVIGKKDAMEECCPDSILLPYATDKFGLAFFKPYLELDSTHRKKAAFHELWHIIEMERGIVQDGYFTEGVAEYVAHRAMNHPIGFPEEFPTHLSRAQICAYLLIPIRLQKIMQAYPQPLHTLLDLEQREKITREVFSE